jgi:hypothetical protein
VMLATFLGVATPTSHALRSAPNMPRLGLYGTANVQLGHGGSPASTGTAKSVQPFYKVPKPMSEIAGQGGQDRVVWVFRTSMRPKIRPITRWRQHRAEHA